MSFHKNLKIKQFLTKKQKQNHSIPQSIWMKTGNKIRYNSKKRHWWGPSWASKEPHLPIGTHLCYGTLTESQQGKVTAVWTAHGRNGMFGSWCFLASGSFGSEINTWNLLLELLLYYSGLWWCTEQIAFLSGGKRKKRICLAVQMIQVRSLVRQLRSHVPPKPLHRNYWRPRSTARESV